MYVVASTTLMATLTYKYNLINRFQLIWILSSINLVCIWITLPSYNTTLFLNITIAQSKIVSYPSFIPYHSQWDPILWVRTSLPLKPNVLNGYLQRAGFHPIIVPISSCNGYWLIIKITSKYHSVIMFMYLVNLNLIIPKLSGPLTPSIWNPWTSNKEVLYLWIWLMY